MNIQEFIASCDTGITGSHWPENWHPLQQALALDRAGHWDTAHSIAQDDPTPQGSAVHAYLHRKEGVQWNAEYWYRRAGRLPFNGTLEEEWNALALELLN